MKKFLFCVLLFAGMCLLFGCNNQSNTLPTKQILNTPAPLIKSPTKTSIEIKNLPSATIAAIETYVPTLAPTKEPTSSLTPTITPCIPTSTQTAMPSLPPKLKDMVVAYINNHEISVWENEELIIVARTNYEPLTIPNLRQIALSEDGNKIAYIDNAYEVWVFDRDESRKTLLIPPNVFNDSDASTNENEIIVPYHIQWLPQSPTILVTTLSWIDTGFYFPINDLYLVNTITGKLDIQQRKENGVYLYPSPDGESIAYVGHGYIGVMNSDASNPRKLLEYPSVSVGFHLFYPQVVWSEDNQSFTVILPPSMDRISDPAKVWKISLDSSTELLTEFPWTENQYVNPLATLSPDFSHMIYSMDHLENEKENELHLVSLSVNQDKKIHEGKVNEVGWSPLSQQFFVIVEEDGNNVLIGDMGGNLSPIDINISSIKTATWINEDSILLISDNAIKVAILSEQRLYHLAEIDSWYLFDQFDIAK